MSDGIKKPKGYRRGRCREFERTYQAAETKPCAQPFPCLVNILVLSGLEQPCKACAPHVQEMRALDGWERHPAKHGTFYTSGRITADQQLLILHRIGQADVRNWLNT